MRELTVRTNDASQRLDKFLQKALPALPPALMYRYFREKRFRVNGVHVQPSLQLRDGDRVQLYIKDEFFEAVTADDAYLRLTPHVSVLYEDRDILVVEKPAGQIVHADSGEELDTLINHIKAYLYRKGEYRPGEEQTFAPALCNRIDRNTGGIVIAAKTAQALRCMNEKIKAGEVTKLYLCAVHGGMPAQRGMLEGFLVKNSADNTVHIFDHRPSGGAEVKEIRTEYRVLADNGLCSLLLVHLITGRTHQIRAHFAHIGHPLLGDGKYGVNREDRREGYKYQALYASRVTFDFKGTSALDTLRGKTVAVDPAHIWFLSEFPHFSGIPKEI